VTGAADVLDLVGTLGTDAAPELRGEERPHDGLPRDVLRVFEALPRRGGLRLDAIIVRAGLAVPTVLAALAELEREGLAVCVDGAWRLRVHPAKRATG
jgi:DNA processing protein